MFGETTVSYVKNWNHPVETTNKKWLFGVPGLKYSKKMSEKKMPPPGASSKGKDFETNLQRVPYQIWRALGVCDLSWIYVGCFHIT